MTTEVYNQILGFLIGFSFLIAFIITCRLIIFIQGILSTIRMELKFIRFFSLSILNFIKKRESNE